MSVSAADFVVKGKVIDGEGEPEAYATVRIFAEGDSVKAASLGIVGDDGAFSQTLPSAGRYELTISSVGKTEIKMPLDISASKKIYDLGVLTMTDAAAELGEVEVVARKPLVTREIDRIGYDVQADVDSKTATVRDILRKVPMVTVDADGTIKVKGSSDFKIYKDGKPNNAFTNNAKDIFAAIPASMIKKIEVITDPGSREDAEGVGAILNIVTNENTEINGIMGMASLTYMTKNEAPAANMWLSGNIGKVMLSVNGGYFHQGGELATSEVEGVSTFVGSGNSMHMSNRSKANGNMGFWGVDGSYELDSLNLFTIEFNGFTSKSRNHSFSSTEMTGPEGDLLYSYGTRTFSPSSSYLSFNGNFNYQRMTRRKGEIITLLYQISNNTNKSESESEYVDMINFPAPYTGKFDFTDQKFLEQTVQADWERPLFKNGKISVGGKFIHRNNHAVSDNEYIGVDNIHSDFVHTTTVTAGYFDYRHTFGKFSARAGLRYEYSHLAAKFKDGSKDNFGSDLNDWVPNASIMYSVNDAHSLKLSYSTRIARPGITTLDPTRNLSPNSLSYGNPDLESTHNKQLSLNYSLIKQKFNINFDASYLFADNTITYFTEVDPDNNDFMTSTYGNIGRNHRWVFSLFGQWTVTSKTSLMVNASANHRKIRIPGVENAHWGYDMFLRATQDLPWKLRLEGMLYYSNGSLDDVYSYNDNGASAIMWGFTLQRSFLKNDRLTLKLMCQSPFCKKNVWRTVTNRGDYVGWSEYKGNMANMYAVSLSFRFGSTRAQVKKTQRSISNDDLQGGNSAPSTSTGMGGM